MSKHKLLKTSMIIALVAASMAACDSEDASDIRESESKFKTSVVSQSTMNQTNIEKDALVQLERTLKASDPTIHDVSPTMVDGKRTIVITRAQSDGTYDSWTMDPGKFAAIMNDASVKVSGKAGDSENGGYSMGNVLTGALMGAAVGAIAANMFNSSSGSNFRHQNASSFYGSQLNNRSSYNSAMSGFQARTYDRERERERKGGGGYVSPFIGQHATAAAAASGKSGYSYQGAAKASAAAYPPPARSSYGATSGGRGASTQAFSSGARGSVSSSS